MNNIDIDVNLEELESITNFFNEHINAGVEDINNVLKGIKKINQYWTGNKFLNVINYFPNMKDLICIRRIVSYTKDTFSELSNQYKSVMTGDKFVDFRKTEDQELLNPIRQFITEKAGINETTQTTYHKDNVDYEVQHSIYENFNSFNNHIQAIYDRLDTVSDNIKSNALSRYVEKTKAVVKEHHDRMKIRIEEFCIKLETSKKEIETIEERARMAISNM